MKKQSSTQDMLTRLAEAKARIEQEQMAIEKMKKLRMAECQWKSQVDELVAATNNADQTTILKIKNRLQKISNKLKSEMPALESNAIENGLYEYMKIQSEQEEIQKYYLECLDKQKQKATVQFDSEIGLNDFENEYHSDEYTNDFENEYNSDEYITDLEDEEASCEAKAKMPLIK